MKKLLLTFLLCLILTTPAFGQFFAPNQKPMLGLQINKAHPLGDPVAFWPFNEGSGGQVFDLSGNGWTGTEQQDSVWQPGKFGSCRYFSGDDEIHIAEDPIWDMPGGMFTISIWMCTTTQQGPIGTLTRDVSNNKYMFYMDSDSGLIAFFVRTTSGSKNTNTGDLGDGYWSDGVWHHLVGTFNKNLGSARIKLYIDGVLNSTNDGYAESPSAGDEGIVLGYSSYGFFTGKLDLPMIYNRALTASEIALLYREPFCMFEPSWNWMFYGGIGITPSGQVIFINMN